MKKFALSLMALLLVVALAGCGSKAEVADIDIAAAADEVLNSGAFTDLLSQPAEGVPAKIYGFDDASVEKCVMYYGTGATAEEIFLAKAVSEDAAAALLQSCEERIQNQKTAFESYVPEELPKLDSAYVKQSGCYVAFVVSGNADAVAQILDSYFAA